MAERLSVQFRRLLEDRKLQRIRPKDDLIAKEIVLAEYDLGKTKNFSKKMITSGRLSKHITACPI